MAPLGIDDGEVAHPAEERRVVTVNAGVQHGDVDVAPRVVGHRAGMPRKSRPQVHPSPAGLADAGVASSTRCGRMRWTGWLGKMAATRSCAASVPRVFAVTSTLATGSALVPMGETTNDFRPGTCLFPAFR